MTIRQILNRTKRRVVTLWFVCFGLFILGPIVFSDVVFMVILGLVGFGIAFVTMFYSYMFGLPCPKCRTSWGLFAYHHGGFSISQRIRFCPFCGTNIDDDLQSMGQENANHLTQA